MHFKISVVLCVIGSVWSSDPPRPARTLGSLFSSSSKVKTPEKRPLIYQVKYYERPETADPRNYVQTEKQGVFVDTNSQQRYNPRVYYYNPLIPTQLDSYGHSGVGCHEQDHQVLANANVFGQVYGVNPYGQVISPYGQVVPNNFGQVPQPFGNVVPQNFGQVVPQTFGQVVPQTFGQVVPQNFNQVVAQPTVNQVVANPVGTPQKVVPGPVPAVRPGVQQPIREQVIQAATEMVNNGHAPNTGVVGANVNSASPFGYYYYYYIPPATDQRYSYTPYTPYTPYNPYVYVPREVSQQQQPVVSPQEKPPKKDT